MNDAKTNPWAECKRLEAENARLKEELKAARKVCDASEDWADAWTAYDAGAGGSGAYLRAREGLLMATVRDYRKLKEGKDGHKPGDSAARF